MEPITSIADLFFKIEKDSSYKELLIYAYMNYTSNSSPTYEKAVNWLEKWIETYINTNITFDCTSMVGYINDQIPKVLNYVPCKIERTTESLPILNISNFPYQSISPSEVNNSFRITQNNSFPNSLCESSSSPEMMEYGWRDEIIETQIYEIMMTSPLIDRNQAIIRVFQNFS